MYYRNPEVDGLIVEQSRAIDPATRQTLLDRVQELVFFNVAIGLNDVEVAGLTTMYFERAWLQK